VTNISLIFDEGPIARCYLQILKKLNFNVDNIIYLGSSFPLIKNIFFYLNNINQNSYAINFLSFDKNRSKVEEIENQFNLGKDFFINAYLKKNNLKNLNFANSNSVNSDNFFNLINNLPESFFLNTSKQIYKRLNFKNNKKIIHVHPAYLPDIRGADGSLWSIKILNKFSSSAFIMNNGIDTGQILFREKLDIKKLGLFKNLNSIDLIKFWFSFIDPAIRCHNLLSVLKNDLSLDSDNQDRIEGKYYSFMDFDKKVNVINEIICN
jgi:hypothetical protein